MKHNLKEAIEILDTEPAFLPLYLHEWKEELQQLKEENDSKTAIGEAIRRTINEVLGETT